MDATARAFIAHANDLTTLLRSDLQQLRAGHTHGPTRRALLAAVFRRVHSLKSLARTVELNATAHLAHEVESALETLRGERRVTDTFALDVLARGIHDLARGLRETPEPAPDEELLAHLRELAVPAESPLSAALPGEWATSLTEAEAWRAQAARAEGLRLVAVTINFDFIDFDESLRALSADLAAAGELLATQPLLPEAPAMLAFRLLYATSASDHALAARLTAYGPFLLETVAAPEPEKALPVMTQTVLNFPPGRDESPAQAILEYIARAVTKAAQEAGQEIVVSINGGDTLWPAGYAGALTEMLLQLARNAVSHGIEPPAVRRAAGKPAPGRITLATRRDEAQIIVQVADDGCGLDYAAIAARAPSANPAEIIFQAGFSTAPGTSLLAGRGVGLDIVQESLHQLGGRVEVASAGKRGTTFTLFIPAS